MRTISRNYKLAAKLTFVNALVSFISFFMDDQIPKTTLGFSVFITVIFISTYYRIFNVERNSVGKIRCSNGVPNWICTNFSRSFVLLFKKKSDVIADVFVLDRFADLYFIFTL